MSAEGHVLITVDRRRVPPAHVELTSPADIAAMLVGRSPGEALAIVRKVYALCGTAQSHAGVAAVEAALRHPTHPDVLIARHVLTMAETMREHVVRIVLDWPGMAETEFDVAPYRPLLRSAEDLAACVCDGADVFAVGAEKGLETADAVAVLSKVQAMLSNLMFGEAPSAWLARRGLDSLFAWARTADMPAGAMIRHARKTGRFFADARSTRLLAGDPCPLDIDIGDDADVPETGVFARRAADPLIASLGPEVLGVRLVGRLVELARLPGEMQALLERRAMPPTSGLRSGRYGVGCVEAARGKLLHQVAIDGGRIAGYRVLAPTQWNFHERGVAARCLNRIAATDPLETEAQARLLVQAIDPCVACEMRVH